MDHCSITGPGSTAPTALQDVDTSSSEGLHSRVGYSCVVSGLHSSRPKGRAAQPASDSVRRRSRAAAGDVAGAGAARPSGSEAVSGAKTEEGGSGRLKRRTRKA